MEPEILQALGGEPAEIEMILASGREKAANVLWGIKWTLQLLCRYELMIPHKLAHQWNYFENRLYNKLVHDGC